MGSVAPGPLLPSRSKPMRTTRSSGTPVKPLGNPDLRRGPSEQQTGELDPPFKGGGRRADLPGDYDQRAAADADWRKNLDFNSRQDREAVGQQKSLDGTPWLRSNREK